MAVDYNKRPNSGGSSGAGSGAGAGGAGGINLSKITLTKSAPSVSLKKQGASGGILRVNLNWTTGAAEKPKGGLFRKLAAGGGSGNIDLDIGCLYEFSDGSKGVVQALGEAFESHQSFSNNPIVRLDGDDRSGTNTDGENLFIDLDQAAHIRRILVFAFIYQGTPNWASANAVVTLHPAGGGGPVEILLDESDPKAPMCAIALLEGNGGDVTVQREVKYIHGGQSLLDRTYDWGMDWTPGRK